MAETVIWTVGTDRRWEFDPIPSVDDALDFYKKTTGATYHYTATFQPAIVTIDDFTLVSSNWQVPADNGSAYTIDVDGYVLEDATEYIDFAPNEINHMLHDTPATRNFDKGELALIKEVLDEIDLTRYVDPDGSTDESDFYTDFDSFKIDHDAWRAYHDAWIAAFGGAGRPNTYVNTTWTTFVTSCAAAGTFNVAVTDEVASIDDRFGTIDAEGTDDWYVNDMYVSINKMLAGKLEYVKDVVQYQDTMKITHDSVYIERDNYYAMPTLLKGDKIPIAVTVLDPVIVTGSVISPTVISITVTPLSANSVGTLVITDSANVTLSGIAPTVTGDAIIEPDEIDMTATAKSANSVGLLVVETGTSVIISVPEPVIIADQLVIPQFYNRIDVRVVAPTVITS